MRAWPVWAALVLGAPAAGAAPPAQDAPWVEGSGCGGTECSTTVTYSRPASWRDVSEPGAWEFALASDTDPNVRFRIAIAEAPAGKARPAPGAGAAVALGRSTLQVTEPDDPPKQVEVAVFGAAQTAPDGTTTYVLSEAYRLVNHNIARDVVVACAVPQELAHAYEAVCRRLLQSVAIASE